MIKRLAGILVASAIVVTTFSGCTKDENTISKGDNDPNKVITINIGGGSLEDLNKDDFGKWIKKENNVDFNIINIESNDQLRMRAATNDLPDMFSLPLGTTEYYNYSSQELIREIPEDILEKYPNCKKDVDDNEILTSLKKSMDGVYAIPIPDSKRGLTDVLNVGIYYRADWAKKVGITKMPETVDDMYEMFKRFTTQDPDGNGRDDTYGVSGNIWQVHLIPWLELYGWVKEDGKWIPAYVSREMIPALKYWNRAKVEGVLDPEFSGANLNPTDLFTAGTVGVMYKNCGWYWSNNIIKNLFGSKNEDIKDPYEAVKFIAPGPKKDANSKSIWPYALVEYGTAIGANADDEKMERILKLLEFLKSDETFKISNRGFEGTDYEMKDGKFVSLIGYLDKDNLYPRPIWDKYDSVNVMQLARGSSDFYAEESATLLSPQSRKVWTDTVNAYEPTVSKDPTAIEVKYIYTEEKSEFNYNYDQIEADIAGIVSGKDVEKDFAEFKERLYSTYNLQGVIDSVNRVVQERGIN